MEYFIYNGELYHHGVKGMRWGIRRYQNKDGSLTPAGRKRMAKLEAEMNKLGGKKTKTEEAPRKKTVGEMSDAEIRDRINRMNLEKQYYDTRKSLAASNPPQVSKGKKFIDGLLNDVIVPGVKEAGKEAIKTAGKNWIENFMRNKMGIDTRDATKVLEEEAKRFKASKEIEEYKRDIKKIRSGETSNDGYSLDEILEAYRNIPKETRDELADAAKIQENLNKVTKKNK